MVHGSPGECLPRMRGDPPWRYACHANFWVSTPHARGSTLRSSARGYPCVVYPACAGIHRHTKWQRRKKDGLPRMRGDPPVRSWIKGSHKESTPHARGSTSIKVCIKLFVSVYPACAGIHRQNPLRQPFELRLPRMRGDPPPGAAKYKAWLASTPHARGSTFYI